MSTTLKYLDDGGLAVLWNKIKAIAGEDNVIEAVKVNGTAISITNKTADIGFKINNQQVGVSNDTAALTISGAHGASVSFDASTNTLSIDVPVDTTITDGSTNPVDGNAVYDALALKAPLDSPSLTGTPTAPTATAGTNTTQIATTAFVSAAIAAAALGVSFEIVQTLPQTGQQTNVIYLVPASSSTTQNIYDEYIWVVVDSTTNPATYGWEKIGTTAVDLTDYTRFDVSNGRIYDGNGNELIPMTYTGTGNDIDTICT